MQLNPYLLLKTIYNFILQTQNQPWSSRCSLFYKVSHSAQLVVCKMFLVKNMHLIVPHFWFTLFWPTQYEEKTWTFILRLKEMNKQKSIMLQQNVIYKRSDVCNMINAFHWLKGPIIIWKVSVKILSKGMLLKKLSSQNDLSSEESFPSHLKEA